MTSSRLPGKVLLPSCGKPMLEIMVERVKRTFGVAEVVLATTTNESDDPIVALAERLSVGVHRGSESDVLQRVLGAAKAYGGEIIMELTGDCPLTDPEILSWGLNTYLVNDCDYLTNVDIPGFPIGLDVQVFSTELLAQADREGSLPEDREHVSWFFRRQPERFKIFHLAPPQALYYPSLRLTLDEQQDYLFLDAILQELYFRKPGFGWREILELISHNPQLRELNATVRQRHPLSSH